MMRTLDGWWIVSGIAYPEPAARIASRESSAHNEYATIVGTPRSAVSPFTR
jgi:hypothetical protein